MPKNKQGSPSKFGDCPDGRLYAVLLPGVNSPYRQLQNGKNYTIILTYKPIFVNIFIYNKKR